MITLLYSALNIPLCCLCCHVITLVVELFTLAKPYLDFHHRTLEIYRYWYKRKPLLLDLAQKVHYLLFVEQKLPDPHGVAIENVTVVVRRNVHTLYPKLAVVYRTPAIFQVNAAAAYGFDFRAYKLNSRLVAVEDKIFMPRLAVFGNCFKRSLFHSKRPFLAANNDTANLYSPTFCIQPLGSTLLYNTFFDLSRQKNAVQKNFSERRKYKIKP